MLAGAFACVYVHTHANTHTLDMPVLVIGPLIASRQRDLAYKLYNKAYYPGW